MFQSLRVRLGLSHTLPLLVVFPLLGLSLLYLLETRYFLGNLAQELTSQGMLIAAFTKENRDLWQDPEAARSQINALLPATHARLMLIDAQGNMLASSLEEDQDRIGLEIDAGPVPAALAGRTDWAIDFSAGLQERVVDIAVPVVNRSGVQVGVIRLSHGLAEIETRLVPLRWLVTITLVVLAAMGLLIGLFLARSIGLPIVELERTVNQWAPAAPAPAPLESGPQEIRQLGQSFRRMAGRLNELERGRRLLVASIVHELGRPLGAIKAGVQAILDGAYEDQGLTVELATGIDSQVTQLRRVIDDLTVLGESNLSELSLERRMVHLEEIIETQCQAQAHLARQKNIELVWDCQGAHPPLSADPERLGQIVSNLIHNAIKYSRAGARVDVRLVEEFASGQPAFLRVQVQDSGPGIPHEEQERIFELYYRNPGQKRIHQGMGIGLAVSRRMAQAHGGTLSVESEPGSGSTFTLRLPLHSENENGPDPAA